MAAHPGKRWRPIALVLGALVVLGLVAAAFLFPWFLKRYIERNSESWIDRRITIGSIVLNPFTGVYAVHDLVCFEPRNDQVFVSFSKLGIKGSVLDGLLNERWSFRDAELRDPYVHIVHIQDRFNFSDLLELGGSGETADVAEDGSSGVSFVVEGIIVTGGRMDYFADLLHEPLRIIDVEASCTRITSDDSRMDFRLGMGLPNGTRLEAEFMIDTDQERYGVDARLRDLDLGISLPYLQDFFAAGALDGRLDLDLAVQQSYVDSGDVHVSAALDLRGLKLVDDRSDHLLSVGRLQARLDTLVGSRFDLGAVLVDGLDTRFTLMADGTDNWTRLLQLVPDSAAGAESMVLDASESNYLVLLADYVSYLGRTVTSGDYAADSILVRDGRLLFEDHTMPRSFRYDLSGIELRARRFNAQSPTAPVTAKAILNGVGSVTARADFDPQDLRNVDLDLVVDSLIMAHLDPYVQWYAAHPALEGMVRYEGKTSIRDGKIDSRNALTIDHLRFGKKHGLHAEDIYVLPLRLAAGLLKDTKGLIRLDVPVKGDLRDPRFRVWPIVWQVLKNLVLKAVAAPAKLIAGLFEGADEKDLEWVRFMELQVHPEQEQVRVLGSLARALHAKPDLRVDLVPLVDSLAEAGELALFHSKVKYLFPGPGPLSGSDSARAMDMAAMDSAFVQWMDRQLPGTADRPMVQRSMQLLGATETWRRWEELELTRREHTMQLLLDAGIEKGRIRYRAGSPAEVAALRGAPGYRFVYAVEDDP